MLKLEAILITHDRPALLEQCLVSLESAAFEVRGRLQLRVRIGVNGPCANSVSVLEGRTSLEYDIAHFEMPLRPSAARNRVLARAQGEWLFFIDDDAFIGRDFFSIFLKTLERQPDCSVIGGPNLTPLGSSVFQRASGVALSSRFGASASCVRYKPRTMETRSCGDESLILCNMFVKTDAMRTLQFPEGLICNEENWILQDLKKRGDILIYEPSLSVWHERRKKPLAFAAQIHKYGIGRGQNLRLRPATLEFRHVIPALSLLFTAIAIAMMTWLPLLGQAWFACLLVYLAIWTGATARLKSGASEHIGVCLLGGLLFPVIHVTYGAGVLRGLARR
jgi:succinoglycan biosynthesis protein ExoA